MSISWYLDLTLQRLNRIVTKLKFLSVYSLFYFVAWQLLNHVLTSIGIFPDLGTHDLVNDEE